MAKKSGTINIKKSRQGLYKARAKARGRTSLQQAHVDLSKNSQASSTIKKRARFVVNANSFHH